MRLLERTLQMISIHARVHTEGAMGGRARVLKSEGVSVRASVLPDGGDAETGARGDVHTDRVRLLVSRDTRVTAGDGVSMNDTMYIVRAINRWRAHLELICEARKG